MDAARSMSRVLLSFLLSFMVGMVVLVVFLPLVVVFGPAFAVARRETLNPTWRRRAKHLSLQPRRGLVRRMWEWIAYGKPKGHPGLACGNERHPSGPWHLAALIPGPGGPIADRVRSWLRRRMWGCSCPVPLQPRTAPEQRSMDAVQPGPRTPEVEHCPKCGHDAALHCTRCGETWYGEEPKADPVEMANAADLYGGPCPGRAVTCEECGCEVVMEDYRAHHCPACGDVVLDRSAARKATPEEPPHDA